MKNRSPIVYEFGPFRLDTADCRLLRRGQPIALRPKLYELLKVLVEHSGRMVGKDELINTVWPDLNVEDSNLTVSINALRRTLGDNKYIETVTKRGYRFAMGVRAMAVQVTSGGQATSQLPAPEEPEPPGGAMPLDSRFYIARRADEEFHEAIARRYSIVLVKGPRQIGKTSLLARGLDRAREGGATVVLTDLQQISSSAFENAEKLTLTLAEMIAAQLESPVQPHQTWNDFLGGCNNLERYLRREAMRADPATPLVWGLDEVDRLFNYDYANEIFGLLRSWHNLRALEPAGPWRRLTLALAYATESHLFITDLNQSPFNVGLRLKLEDFTIAQVAELNRRHGEPLRDEDEIRRFYKLIGGIPYLTHCGLHEMEKRGIGLAEVEARAAHDEGVFGDHLRRLLASIESNEALCDALRAFLRGEIGLTRTNFYQLRSAGVLAGDSPNEARLRCELYEIYLKKHLL
jgi:DNA-binding winged helix-turn-helix (wHTH) protein